jgi:hypothetical protein
MRHDLFVHKNSPVFAIFRIYTFKRADLIRQIETFVARVMIRFPLSIPVLHNWHVSAIRIRRIYPRAITGGGKKNIINERRNARESSRVAFF